MTSNLTDVTEKRNEKNSVLAQSDVQQYRIVFIRSHLANMGFCFYVFSVHFLFKDTE